VLQHGETISEDTSYKGPELSMTRGRGTSEEWVHGLQIWETDCHRAALDHD
jgi:hypothetical protein